MPNPSNNPSRPCLTTPNDTLLIQNGRVLDPDSGFDESVDILIKSGTISRIGNIPRKLARKSIDALGKLVVPGAVDLHVHLRDFDQCHKETIKTGTLAALRGGVTTVFAMPNTKPALDSAETIRRYQAIIRQRSAIQAHVCGAITKGLKGQELADLDQYAELGIRMITDDGCDVDDEALLEKAYANAKENGLVLMTHPEMKSIAPNGVVNEGKVSQKLGVPGQPNEKEWKAVERGIRLALKTGARAHFTHLSTKESVELMRQVKLKTDQITCDTTPHHLSLTEDLVLEKGGVAKVNPPLRTEEDRRALIQGVKDGTIDAIVTDHAPHAIEEKEGDVTQAAFGFTGLETLIPAILQELYFNQGMTLLKIFKLLTSGPAKIAGIDRGRIQIGSPADLTLIDLNRRATLRSDHFASMGKKTPFEGLTFRGWPVATFVDGKMKRINDSLLSNNDNIFLNKKFEQD
jgi:dihydroorotase